MRDALVRDGHDFVWAGDWQPDPGDRAVVDVALTEGRVLVALDKDFGARPWRLGVCDYVAAAGCAPEERAAFRNFTCMIRRITRTEPAR